MISETAHPLYYMLMDNGRRVLVLDARPVDVHPSSQFILHPSRTDQPAWIVTEVSTGRRAGVGPTPEAAVLLARRLLSAYFSSTESHPVDFQPAA